MAENFVLRVPDMAGFEMQYYYNKEESTVQARTFPPHIHDTPELYILTEGSACFAVENRLYQLTAGDIIVSRPNEIHNCILTENSVHQHLCFWFDPTFSLLDRILESCASAGNRISPSPEAKKRLLALYEELSLASKEEKHRKEYALICQILYEIEEGIGEENGTVPVLPEVLSQILQDINENFATIESLSYFTEKYYLSPSTLGRLFRTHLHTSPRSYLETKKLAHSRILLRKGKSVTEACAGAGFTDVSGYIRLFRRRFGITPREYKNG